MAYIHKFILIKLLLFFFFNKNLKQRKAICSNKFLTNKLLIIKKKMHPNKYLGITFRHSQFCIPKLSSNHINYFQQSSMYTMVAVSHWITSTTSNGHQCTQWLRLVTVFFFPLKGIINAIIDKRFDGHQCAIGCG